MDRRYRSLPLVAVALLLGGCVIVADGPAQVAGTGDGRREADSGWTEREVAVGEVRRVVMKSHGRLRLSQGQKARLRITGPRSAVEDLIVRQEGEVLTLEQRAQFDLDLRPLMVWTWPREVEIDLTLPNLEAIRVGSHGRVELAPFAGDSLRIVAEGHGRVSAANIRTGHFLLRQEDHSETRIEELTATRTELDLTGHVEFAARTLTTSELSVAIDEHGAATVAGVVDQQHVRVDDHADYYGERLNCREAIVTLGSHGHARLWVQEHLARDVARGASLRYEGQPRVSGVESDRAG